MTARETAYQRVAARRGMTAAEVEAKELVEWHALTADSPQPPAGGWFTEVQTEFHAICRGE